MIFDCIYLHYSPVTYVYAHSGHAGVPQVFFNSRHVGGIDEIEELERQGVLGDRLKECLEGEGEGEEFPPPLRTPSNEEYLQVREIYLITSWESARIWTPPGH